MTKLSMAGLMSNLSAVAADAIDEAQIVKIHTVNGTKALATPALFAAHQLKRLIVLSERIVQSKQAAFTSRSGELWGRSVTEIEHDAKATGLGQALMAALTIDLDAIRVEYPEHDFHPGVRTMLSVLEEGQLLYQEFLSSAQGMLATPTRLRDQRRLIAQEVFLALRQAAMSEDYRHECNRRYKAVWQRLDSTRELLEAAFIQRSRILSVRVDLRYRHFLDVQRHDPSTPGHPSRDEAFAHWERLRDIIRKRIFKEVWHKYIVRLEWTPQTGFHFHLMLLIEGRKVQDGIDVAEMMGHVWKDEVTHGQGFHFNCNLHALKGGYDVRGTGIFERSDLSGQADLLTVAGYLCKSDFFISYHQTDKQRTYFRSQL